jgi:hypothetical protein
VLKVNGKNYSYLSWADAMKIVLIEFPDMQYEVTRDPYTNLPYFEGEETGLCTQFLRSYHDYIF